MSEEKFLKFLSDNAQKMTEEILRHKLDTWDDLYSACVAVEVEFENFPDDEKVWLDMVREAIKKVNTGKGRFFA